MKMKTLPKFEQLQAALSYDPCTGVITWKYRDWVRKTDNTRLAGKPAGTVCSGGYFQIHTKVDGVFHIMRCHRVAWLLMTGDWPESEIDHKDRDPKNNQWKNLRLATRSQNESNKPGSGRDEEKGCYFVKKTNKWRVYIKVNRRQIYIGTFDSREKARDAFRFSSEKHHGLFAHHLSA